jgi:small subunit ribosomal protein S8
MTDPISDLLTRVRNAQRMGHSSVTLPASKLKLRISEVLLGEGFFEAVEHLGSEPQGVISITLRYGPGRQGAINEIRRVSRPGRRVYVGVDELPQVKSGLGIAVLSTSKGILVDRDARALKVGGELLCTVW